jgi:hypothetical protein
MSYAAYSLLCRCQDSFIQKALGDDMYTSFFLLSPPNRIRALLTRILCLFSKPQCQPSELLGFLENVLSADYVLATENSRISAASKGTVLGKNFTVPAPCNNVFTPPVAPASDFFFVRLRAFGSRG